MTNNPFKKLIFCELCNKPMRLIKDRKNIKYICQTYSRSGGRECLRNPIEYELLIDLITNHYQIHNKELILENEHLRKDIYRLLINNGSIEIEFKNLPNIIVKENIYSHIE